MSNLSEDTHQTTDRQQQTTDSQQNAPPDSDPDPDPDPDGNSPISPTNLPLQPPSQLPQHYNHPRLLFMLLQRSRRSPPADSILGYEAGYGA